MSRSEQRRRAAAVALYQEDVTARPAAELLDREATPFTRQLVEGAAAERDSLDGLIERHWRAGRWTASRRSSGTSCGWRSTSCCTGSTCPPR